MTLIQFSKSHRLLTSEDFLYLKEGSSYIKFYPLIAYFKKSRLVQPETRLGISVSKKVGNSFTRNRFKRIVRERFRLSDIRLLGIDLLFVVSPQLSKISLAEGEVLLEKALREIFATLKK